MPRKRKPKAKSDKEVQTHEEPQKESMQEMEEMVDQAMKRYAEVSKELVELKKRGEELPELLEGRMLTREMSKAVDKAKAAFASAEEARLVMEKALRKLRAQMERYKSRVQGSSTFHLRPVHISATRPRIVDATDRLLLFHETRIGYSIARTDADEGLGPMMRLPRDTISATAKHIRFLSDSSLCYLEGSGTEWNFVVVRAKNDFQSNPEKRIYFVRRRLAIRGLDVWAGRPMISSIRERTETVDFWKLLVPEWTAVDDGDGVVDFIYSTAVAWREAKVFGAASNGRLLLFRLFSKEHYWTMVRDTRTQETRSIRSDHQNRQTEDYSFHAFHGGALCGERLRARISLDLLRETESGYEQRHFAGAIPLSAKMLNTASERECRFLKSGNRFFFELGKIIFMGYFPGTDVSLEAASVAAVWRGLADSTQNELIQSRQYSNRQILLSALKEFDGNTTIKEKKEKPKTPSEPIVAKRELRKRKPSLLRYPLRSAKRLAR